jgi:hypothetical protein
VALQVQPAAAPQCQQPVHATEHLHTHPVGRPADRWWIVPQNRGLLLTTMQLNTLPWSPPSRGAAHLCLEAGAALTDQRHA